MTKKTTTGIFGALIFAAASPVDAREKSPMDCSARDTGFEQKQCAQQALEQSSSDLAKNYKQELERAAAGAALPGGQETKSAAEALAESERTFEAYRDAECRGRVGYGEAGSGTFVWVWGCLAEKNRQRIEELKVPFYAR